MNEPGTPLGTAADAQGDRERGVTEVIAFILVFAIILSSVGVLYTTGFQAMDDYRENEQLSNAQRGMTSLGDNFNDVLRYDGVERRYGELTLRGGTIRTGGENTTIHVATGWNGSDTSVANSTELGALAYEGESATVAYEGGGVFRRSGDYSFAIKQPQVRCTPESDTAVISLLVLDHDGERSFQSSDSVGFTIVETSTTRHTDMSEIDPTADEIRIVVDDGPYQDGWNQTLERGGWTRDEDDPGYTCDVEDLEVQIVTAEIEY
ncbi:DUF7289 family protein [Halosolutus halophilus]|uniref:DUF7289 family protein n=1 Tax=Halosolutus halophilus TaxID=1552990 RepID=UPI0022351162|nr:hypothetical protein [Halosolutus halophilus]